MASPLEIATWCSLTGVVGFQASSLQNPPLLSLRCIHIEFSHNTILCFLHPNDHISSFDSRATMLHQLFHLPVFQVQLAPMLTPVEHYPIVLHCNILMTLDVTVVQILFPLMSEMLVDVQFSLRSLIFCYCMLSHFSLFLCSLNFGFSIASRVFNLNTSHTHISLSLLMSLCQLTVHICLWYWHYSMESVFTWSSLHRTLESSKLSLIVQYEGDDHVLQLNLCCTHIECIFGDPDTYYIPRPPFHGELHVQLVTQAGKAFEHCEYMFVQHILDTVCCSQRVEASVLPVELVTPSSAST